MRLEMIELEKGQIKGYSRDPKGLEEGFGL